MGNNYLKNWLQKTQNQQAINRALQVMQTKGYALPCRVVSVSGSIVTVAFEIKDDTLTLPQVTIPKAESQWMRSPTQEGEYGMTIPSDAYLGGISGLGGGTANMNRRGNLSSLVYVPCGSKTYPSVNPNAAYVAGPQGAVIQTQDGTSSIVVNETGITLKFGGKVVTLNGSGFTIDGILFDTHKHLYSPGTGTPTDTGGPVP
jgi:hypothetical protein